MKKLTWKRIYWAVVIVSLLLIVTVGSTVFMLMLDSGLWGNERVSVTETELETARANSAAENQDRSAKVISLEGEILVQSADTAEAEQEEAAETVSDGDYIFPDSATRRLTEADLEGLSAEELSLGRNEIFARHGRMFQDASIRAYFEGKSWYKGTIEAEDFDSRAGEFLNQTEMANVEFIRAHE